MEEHVSEQLDLDAVTRRRQVHRERSRRFLLGGGLAAMATGVAFAPGRAAASAATDPWLAGGNAGVNTDGTNFLGTKNVAPLVFKTAAVNNTPLERMRLTPAGLLGVGTAAPAAKLHVVQPAGTAVRAESTGTAAGDTALLATTANGRAVVAQATTSGVGVRAIAASGYGVFASASNPTGSAVVGQHTNASGTTPGVLGETNSTSVDAGGVVGRVNPTAAGAGSAGVRGVNKSTAGGGSGVFGEHASSGYGVYGKSVDGYGVYGKAGYAGTYGVGDSYGAIGVSNTGYGVYGSGSVAVYGSGTTYGVQAYGGTYGLYGSGSYGCYGSGSSYGLYGASAGGYGVYGVGSTGVYGSSSQANGVYGYSSEPNSAGVYGYGGQYAVRGVSGRTAGVRGDSGYVGLWGEGPTYGLYAKATGAAADSYGVVGTAGSSAGFAGYFNGKVHVLGTLSKSAGSFKIDHPLEPEKKWLSHSFVESPDMMNIYNGNVVLDTKGEATVELPEYFAALNKDFRYQLTCIGGHANVYIASKVSKNSFRIGGGSPGLEVSWQVTGIRQDDYANENRVPVETPKSKTEVGMRSFVPKGSSAKLMSILPAVPDEQAQVPLDVPEVPEEPEQVELNGPKR